jgi:hypothetical protein
MLVLIYLISNHVGGVIVSVLASSAVDCGFGPWSDQTKDFKIGICGFSAKHTELRRMSKDWLALNQDNWVEQHVYPQTVVSVSEHQKKSSM